MKFVAGQTEAYFKAAALIDKARIKGYNIAAVAGAFLNDFHVLWGYKSILNPFSGIVENLVVDDEREDAKGDAREYRYNALPFAYKQGVNTKDAKEDIAAAILNGDQRTKYFEHLPYLGNLITENTPTTFICKQLRSQHQDFYVVLYEEVLFYLYAYLEVKGNGPSPLEQLGLWTIDTSVSQPPIPNIYRIKMLCRFTLCAEAWSENAWKDDDSLHTLFGLKNYAQYWGEEEETLVRQLLDRAIDKMVEANDAPNLMCALDARLPKIVDAFIKQFQECEKITLPNNEVECVLLAARFDILHVLKFQSYYKEFDLFVLSVYHTRHDFGTIKLAGYKSGEVPVFTPVLFIGFLETICAITEGKQIDETDESIDGFLLTKLLMKLFSESVVQGKFINEVVKKHLELPATRAAISQVMARNLSHNVGSHVLSKFKSENDIESLIAINKGLYNGGSKYPKGFQYTGPIPDLAHSRDKQIAFFNDYLKSRMDYLADVTMATPLLESTFKFCSGVISGFLKNTVLLNRISGISDGPTYVFKVIRSDYDIKSQKRTESVEYPKTTGNSVYRSDHYSVAMPNDMLGCHAFYIIVENIIRNTYKHSVRAQSHAFEFSIHIGPYLISTEGIGEEKYEPRPDFLMIELYDNNCKSRKDIEAVVNGRNEVFNKEILENGKIRPGGPDFAIFQYLLIENFVAAIYYCFYVFARLTVVIIQLYH